MNTPLITWIATAACLVLVLIVASSKSLWKNTHKSKAKCHSKIDDHSHMSFISMGDERDEFYIPGDALPSDDDEYDSL